MGDVVIFIYILFIFIIIFALVKGWGKIGKGGEAFEVEKAVVGN